MKKNSYTVSKSASRGANNKTSVTPELLINYDISHKAFSFFNMTHSAADFSHLPYFLTLQHFPADVATI